MKRLSSSVVLLLSMVAVPALASAGEPERHDKLGAKPSWRRRAPKPPEPVAPEPPPATTTEASKPATSGEDPIPPGSCRCAIPGAFRHDGFYERLTLGVGYAALWGDGPSGDAGISGLGASLSAYVGGTPWAGLVLGGTFGGTSVSGWFHGAASEGNGTAALPSLALFVDWYPNPQGVWHLGGTFGLGVYGATDIAEASYVGAAFAGSIFGGADLWIGPQFSYGLMLSGSLAAPSSARDDGQPTGHRFMAASILIALTLVYH